MAPQFVVLATRDPYNCSGVVGAVVRIKHAKTRTYARLRVPEPMICEERDDLLFLFMPEDLMLVWPEHEDAVTWMHNIADESVWVVAQLHPKHMIELIENLVPTYRLGTSIDVWEMVSKLPKVVPEGYHALLKTGDMITYGRQGIDYTHSIENLELVKQLFGGVPIGILGKRMTVTVDGRTTETIARLVSQ